MTIMKSREERAEEIQGAIRQILLHDWDPIGVVEVEEAQDEYDSYVGGVYRLLVSAAPPEDVAAHLSAIERDMMGFENARARALLPVARKLCALDVRLHEAK